MKHEDHCLTRCENQDLHKHRCNCAAGRAKFGIGDTVQLNALGKERITYGKPRVRATVVRGSKKHPQSFVVQWEGRRSTEMLHGDFLEDLPE